MESKILRLVLLGIFLVNIAVVVAPYLNTTVTTVNATGGTVSGYEGILYTGQLHNHAGEYGDDGTGTVEVNLDYMRNSATPYLSFGGLAPHSHMVTDSNMVNYWNDMNTRATSTFVPIPGQEWSTLSSSGHVNVFYANERCSVNSGDIPGFYSWIVGSNGYGSFNHPWDSGGSDMNNWQYYASADKPGNYAGKMVMMEMKQSVGSTSGFADYPEALNNGWHIGITVSDDEHNGAPGNKYTNDPRTGMWVTSLAASGVKKAMEELRFFASQDDAGYIDIKAGSYEMGDIATGLGASEYVYAKLNPSLSYTEVNLFYKSGSSYTTKAMTSVGNGEYRVSHACNIDSWFFVRAKASSGAYICSSPIWTDDTPSSSDTTAPAVSITAPASGATVSGTTSISFSATDANGISSRAIKIDGVTKSTSSSYSWDTTAYSNGVHTIVCEATDPSGNTGSDTHSVTVSNTVADDGGVLYDGVAASGHMNSADGADMFWIDVGANALSMRVLLTQSSGDFDTYGKFGSQPTTSSYDWRGYTSGGEDNTISNPAQGRHYIMVDYYSGDADYTLTATITYGTPADTTAPSVSISSPTNGATVSGTVSISFTASDANGISSRAIKIDGVTKSTSTSYSWDTTTYSNGVHTIVCEATDPSGNTGSATRSVTVSNTVADTTAPTVSISTPTSGATVSGTTSISFSATDANGISSRAIKIDGVTKSTSSSYSWDTTTYSNGVHTIVCEATDPSGNTGSATRSVTVSNTVTDDGGALTNGVAATGHMNSADGSDMWFIDVGANAESMYVVLTCGSADFDDYGKFNAQPTTSSYDWRGYTGGGEENTVTSPAQGRHYIMVDYYSGDSDYTLTATITYGSSSGGDVSQIVINEFLPAPSTGSEWIELYNPTSQAIDIGGCKLDDITSGGTAAYTIPSGTSIAANGYKVFYATTTAIALNNAGDTCNFLSSSGTVIDSKSYTSSTSDVSIGRESDGSSTWTTFSSPTPAAANVGTSSSTPTDPGTFTGTCGSDQWFDVYLEAGQTVQITLSWSGSTDLDWFLYRADGSTQVARGYTTSNPESGTWTVDSTGWYKIRINKYSGVDVGFTLTVTYI